MYVPKPYRLTEPARIRALIDQIGFATLVSIDNEGYPWSTHTPIEIHPNPNELILEGHLAKANPHWQYFSNRPQGLAIYLSPINHYISSSWYSLLEVPTWNYISVQVTGIIERIEDQEELWQLVKRLTAKYEKSEKTPINLDEMGEKIRRQLDGIVGFQIKPIKVEASLKLSQTRSKADYNNIIRELKEKDNVQAQLLADLMETKSTKVKKP